MSWLEDLFFLVAFVVAVALVTLSVYDGGNAYPRVSSTQVVAASENPDREMPQAPRIPRAKALSASRGPAASGNTAPAN